MTTELLFAAFLQCMQYEGAKTKTDWPGIRILVSLRGRHITYGYSGLNNYKLRPGFIVLFGN